MSRFSGPQFEGAQAAMKKIRKEEADTRNLLTKPENKSTKGKPKE